MATIRIGLSGWSYGSWRGPFYPAGLPRKDELAFASRAFDTIEVNGTYFSLKSPDVYRSWYETAPEGFVYALKASSFITHAKKLKDVEVPLANFFASGLLRLEEKLGPILWQLPRAAPFDAERLERFFSLLPRDTVEAAELARGHEERIVPEAWAKTAERRPLRHVLEPRREAFFCREMVELARRHGVAVAFSESSGDWPYTEEVTAGFVYLRLHGREATYASRYGDEALDTWAARIGAWSAGGEPPDARRITDLPLPPAPPGGRDVYCYFDNDQKANAPRDARRLAERLAARPAG